MQCYVVGDSTFSSMAESSVAPCNKIIIVLIIISSVKLLWEFNIPMGTQVRHNRPDLVLRSSTQVLLMDVSVPLDHNVPTKSPKK